MPVSLILYDSQYSESAFTLDMSCAYVLHLAINHLLSVPASCKFLKTLARRETDSTNSFNRGACRQLFPSRPNVNGTSTPMATIRALRSVSSAGRLMKALMPAYCSWTKYLFRAHGQRRDDRVNIPMNDAYTRSFET